jgi:hypothetical protein
MCNLLHDFWMPMGSIRRPVFAWDEPLIDLIGTGTYTGSKSLWVWVAKAGEKCGRISEVHAEIIVFCCLFHNIARI